jgi:hypothetical protein
MACRDHRDRADVSGAWFAAARPRGSPIAKASDESDVSDDGRRRKAVSQRMKRYWAERRKAKAKMK